MTTLIMLVIKLKRHNDRYQWRWTPRHHNGLGGHLDVAYNTGDGFLPQVRFMNNAPLGESVSMSVSRFGNVGVAIPAFLVKIIIRTIAATAQGVTPPTSQKH